MRILKSEEFLLSLQEIMEFIAEDSVAEAISFERRFEEKIDALPFSPYKYRRSIFFSDDDIRDLIFKGYVIPYLIDREHSALLILGMTKYRENPFPRA